MKTLDWIVPTFIASIVITLLISTLSPFYLKRVRKKEHIPLYQILIFGLTIVGVVLIIILAPFPKPADFLTEDSWAIKSTIIGFLGVVISGAIAISATSFLGNAIASLMIRSSNNFRVGDFIRINEFVGAVKKRGLFDVDIQIENRAIISLPNIYVITYPVEVIPREKRIVSADITMGYEIPRQKVEAYLIEAATHIGLSKPYVFVQALLDAAVQYRVIGFSSKTGSTALLTEPSELKKSILDTFHKHQVEMVSPSIGIQRDAGDTIYIPPIVKVEAKETEAVKTALPEADIFDKAMQAESIEKAEERLVELDKTIAEVEKELATTTDEHRKEQLKGRLENIKQLKEKLKTAIHEEKKKMEDE